MFRSVLEHAHADGVVVERIDGDALEASPAKGENEGVVIFQCFGVPSMPFNADLYVAEPFFSG